MLARLAAALFLCCLFVGPAGAAPPAVDKKGCTDSKLLTRMPGCLIRDCKASEYEMAKIRTSKPKTEMLEGAFEEIRYFCAPDLSPAAVGGNVAGALTAAGYEITVREPYATTRYWVTGRKGPQWVAVYAEKGNYILTTLRLKELEQVIQATADGWADQINKTGRVSVYGINFDTAKATLRPDSEQVLQEVSKLLEKNPDWYLLVGGHTDSTGSDAVNVPLSRQRAEAVVAWLAKAGVDAHRLTAAGFGARKPVGDNAGEDGRAKNRRVDLIKLY